MKPTLSEEAKEIAKLVSKGMEQAPSWLRPLLVLAGFGSVFTFAVGTGLTLVRSYEIGFNVSFASMLLMAVTVTCLVMLVRIGHRVVEDPPPSAPAAPPAPPKEAKPETPPAEPKAEPAVPVAAPTANAGLLLRAVFCPNLEPIGPVPLGVDSVCHTWADPRGGSLKATFNDEDSPDYLIVEFENKPGQRPASVTLRPSGLNPCLRPPDHDFLCVDCLLPAPIDTAPTDRVALEFRLYDAQLTCWLLGTEATAPTIQTVKAGAKNKWTTLSLPLAPEHWKRISANPGEKNGQAKPDFETMLLAVEITPGSWQGPAEPPGPGRGKFLLKNLRLVEAAMSPKPE